MISPAHSNKPKARSRQCPQCWWHFNDTTVSVFPDETFSLVNAAYLGKIPILHILEAPTQRACCKNPPPQQRSNDILWIYVCLLTFQHLFPQSTSVKGFSKPNISKTTDSNVMALSSLASSSEPADNLWHEFAFYTPKQANSWMHLMFGYIPASQMPLSVTVVPRTSVHEDRSQIILRARLNGSSLPFQALLWEHRWLALCLKPALPGTGTSVSSWLCTLSHSDDFFQVLPSSLFWLVYDLVCLVSLPCLQPPGKEGDNKDPAMQR